MTTQLTYRIAQQRHSELAEQARLAVRTSRLVRVITILSSGRRELLVGHRRNANLTPAGWHWRPRPNGTRVRPRPSRSAASTPALGTAERSRYDAADDSRTAQQPRLVTGYHRRRFARAIRFVLGGVLALLLVAASPAAALEQKLSAADGAGSDALGSSVAIDGETIVLGAPGAPDE